MSPPDAMHAARVRIVVTGRVQGVGFRESTRRAAQSLGLVGTVRNLSTGQVEVVAEGPRPVVEQLVRWTAHGPSAARVDDLEAAYTRPTGRDTSFRVTY